MLVMETRRERRKGGRPRLTDERRRTGVQQVRATEDDLRLLRRIAYDQGQTASKLLHDEIRRIISASSSMLG